MRTSVPDRANRLKAVHLGQADAGVDGVHFIRHNYVKNFGEFE